MDTQIEKHAMFPSPTASTKALSVLLEIIIPATFYNKVVENLKRSPGIDPANVLITIAENHDIDWSFRDGIAQFVP